MIRKWVFNVRWTLSEGDGSWSDRMAVIRHALLHPGLYGGRDCEWGGAGG